MYCYISTEATVWHKTALSVLIKQKETKNCLIIQALKLILGQHFANAKYSN